MHEFLHEQMKLYLESVSIFNVAGMAALLSNFKGVSLIVRHDTQEVGYPAGARMIQLGACILMDVILGKLADFSDIFFSFVFVV